MHVRDERHTKRRRGHRALFVGEDPSASSVNYTSEVLSVKSFSRNPNSARPIMKFTSSLSRLRTHQRRDKFSGRS